MTTNGIAAVHGVGPGVVPRGFTLIELMVALLVLGILLGIGVPSFRDAALSSRVTGYANDLVTSVQLARSEAIKRNLTVTLCVSAPADGEDCADEGGWEKGWIVRAPVPDPDEPGRVTIIQRQPPLDGGYRLTEAADSTEVAFPATVVRAPPTTLTFTVCRREPLGRQERVVIVSPSGSTSVRRTATGSCPEAG